ncbi:MAG: DUF3570 domain-containing protein [Thermodesulfovibrionales bacterium]
MRSIASIILISFLLSSVPIYADELVDEVSITYNSYSDNTDSEIDTYILGITKKISDRFGIGLNVGYDAITTATPPSNSDTATEAGITHEEKYESNRLFPTLMVIYDDGDNNFVLGGYYSKEDDYTGRTIFTSYTRQLNMQNTSMGIGLSQSFDEWELDGLAEDQRKDTQVNLTASQILSKTSQLQFIYSYIYSDGLIASPYRNIEIDNTVVNERLPLDRTGQAFALRYVKLIFKPTSINLYYRYYFDDWEIISHTASAELYHDITETLTLGGLYRYYDQTGAKFTQNPEVYSLDDKYIAVDYKYSDFSSQTAGLALIFNPDWDFLFDWENLKFKASYDYYWTSGNDHIKYWYDVDNIKAQILSLSIDYSF